MTRVGSQRHRKKK